MANLTTIILTYNEELNIRDCIKSVEKISKRIIVIDSYSSDRTVEIAREIGAEVLQNKFVNHALQFNYGLDNSNIDTQWVFRIDADERLTKESSAEIEKLCKENKDTNVNGVVVRFRLYFLGKKMRFGGVYPIEVLRLFKTNYGKYKNKNMDEHIELSQGRIVTMKSDINHFDFKNLETWISKHNIYSTKEMIDYFDKSTWYPDGSIAFNSKIKRFLKYKIYYKLSLGFRPLIYFIYRYIFKLGFLDGKEGLIFAVLQAYWYRFLVDAKIYEYQLNEKRNLNET